MENTKIHRVLMLFLLGILAYLPMKAQYMPVVFDKSYGTNNKIQQVCLLAGDEVAMIGKEGQKYNLTWADRVGEVVFSLPLIGFTTVNQVKELDDNKLLLVGQSVVNNAKGRKGITLSGRAVIIDRGGKMALNLYIGSQGSDLLNGALLRSGSLMLSGTEPMGTNGRQGVILKVDKAGKVLYEYKHAESGYCDLFDVLGNSTEYVCAAFSAGKEKEKAAIVRLDDKGKPFYITTLPSGQFKVTGMQANINDGSVIVIGNATANGGIVYKLRPEGDIVFAKTLIPTTQEGVANLNHLMVGRNGNILVGGSGSRGHYALLRNDGTSLYSGSSNGGVRGMGMNPVTGESVVTTYDINGRRGTFVRISATGKAEFDRTVDGNFDQAKVFNNGEVLLLSSDEGRISMYSAQGEKEFDRYITDNKPTIFKQALTAASGEVVFVDASNRLVKLGHGLYVSDVKITKPVNGTATAVFTVTLTGYATTKEGAPIPVNVDYTTRELSATTASNFTPVKGKLSFTPSPGTADRYLVKQDIEVPVKANDLIEGSKEFELNLSAVQYSYLVKPAGKAVIEDQQSLVKLIRTEKGEEGGQDILYELGLFKTDGTPLINATGAHIVVDGIYGEGTADALDFDKGLTPRVVFENGRQKGLFYAKTLEDTRYELPKTVVVNFNKIHNLSGSNVSFDGELLSCSGMVIDQPAKIAIASLGDHRVNNNVVSGFFTVSLLRASDGALQTNATGSDVIVNCVPVSEATAKEGKDYVFTNLHELRISGDGNHSSANVNGVVLFSTDTLEKQVKLNIKSVNQPVGAQPVGVSEAERSAEFTIRK
ncbi:Calx-beta domain-containing protein [Bacteroides sp.]|uniref:Calx-beta domain-containing protein n=1 Tax=Bacteroides sp. TaxID=29523 RepID=UPI002FC8499D